MGSIAASLSLDGSPVVNSGKLSEPFARSTIKVVILTLLLRERGGPGGLSAEEQELAQRMIIDSDNEAAADLYSILASIFGGSPQAAKEMTYLLRKSGDEETTVPPSVPLGLPPSFISNYGATFWLPGNQVKFLNALTSGSLVDDESEAFVLGLMKRITPLGGSSWGLGAVSDEVRPSYKPGWGDTPGGQYLARQFGRIGPDGKLPSASVALAAIAPSQDQAYGAVTQLAEGLVEILRSGCGR